MRRWRDRRDDGASAVEFALVLPLLLLVVFGIISFGMYFAGALALSNGSREGARYAVVQNRTCQDIVSAVKDSVVGGLGLQFPVTVTVSRSTGTGSVSCAGSVTATGAVTITSGSGSTVMCSGSKTGQDELAVTSQATASILVPGWLVKNDFPVSGTGRYRCEFS